ncbi:MAG: hypothetical protein U1A78_37965 [Polyangia bacterium]
MPRLTIHAFFVLLVGLGSGCEPWQFTWPADGSSSRDGSSVTQQEPDSIALTGLRQAFSVPASPADCGQSFSFQVADKRLQFSTLMPSTLTACRITVTVDLPTAVDLTKYSKGIILLETSIVNPYETMKLSAGGTGFDLLSGYKIPPANTMTNVDLISTFSIGSFRFGGKVPITFTVTPVDSMRVLAKGDSLTINSVTILAIK